jgi:LytS/YehU family sensor histidine kinase
VENALKHGRIDRNSPVLIRLKQSGNTLFFETKNKISDQRKDKFGGIGLDNLKKSLKINYPDAHSLILKQEEQNFIAQLDLNLNGKAH